jgi:hypothetical protein
LAIPLGAEFMVAYDPDVWIYLDPVPELRKALKALYMGCRIQSITTYVSRSFYVYFAWKYGKQSSGNFFKQWVTNDSYLGIGNLALFWVLTFVCYHWADCYMTCVALFDYNLKGSEGFINETAMTYYWNVTWLHIGE